MMKNWPNFPDTDGNVSLGNEKYLTFSETEIVTILQQLIYIDYWIMHFETFDMF